MDFLQDIVANKFTALLMALMAVALLIKHLESNVKARRTGLEGRVLFLEKQVLWMAETELGYVELSAKAVTLLKAAASGGERQAHDDKIDELDVESTVLRSQTKLRHESLKAHFSEKETVVR